MLETNQLIYNDFAGKNPTTISPAYASPREQSLFGVDPGQRYPARALFIILALQHDTPFEINLLTESSAQILQPQLHFAVRQKTRPGYGKIGLFSRG